VYLAKNKHTHEEVAVKVVPVEADLDDFMKEIDILKRCTSQYVVGYIGSFLRDPDLYVSSLGVKIFDFCEVLTQVFP
jgi:serine/threonine protein kinase